MAEREPFSDKNNPLVDYSMSKLLAASWIFELPISISEKEVQLIIDSIDDEKEKRFHIQEYEAKGSKCFRAWAWESKRNPLLFSRKGRKILQRAASKSKSPRWTDFETVVERLNSPELIDYYERQRFRYVDWRLLPTPKVSPRYVFKYNKGECKSISGFSLHCLLKVGYKARTQIGRSSTPKYKMHVFLSVSCM